MIETPTPAPAECSADEPKLDFYAMILDEDAQAAVEFTVLLPVYLLLITAVIYTSYLMIIRQQTVEAVRWYAWAIPGNSTNLAYQQTFHGRFIEPGAGGTVNVTPDRNALNSIISRVTQDAQGASREEKELAQQLLSNTTQSVGTNIVRREGKATYNYTFPWFWGRVQRRTVNFEMKHVVYGYSRLGAKREIHKNGFAHPFIRHTSRDRGSLQAFNIYDNRFQPVIMGTGGGFSFNCPGKNHSSHPCMWNTRPLRGRTQGNPFFYHYFNDR